MAKVIAICNQKGGVGKTTTAANLSVALAMSGKKVLALDVTVSTMIARAVNEERFKPTDGTIIGESGVYILPSNLELSALEMTLIGTMNRERALKEYVDKVRYLKETIRGGTKE